MWDRPKGCVATNQIYPRGSPGGVRNAGIDQKVTLQGGTLYAGIGWMGAIRQAVRCEVLERYRIK